ncbi:hypothetical protein BS47DRAFT_1482786 [Hydnum rufescens UP504]|uniref:Uncharacterized protein n=1 Tax=Hydnum rufescens UP504 TaxID=1448309 RepID=A0A9P6DYB9_9AGAM|nr:hypothetical protein BS47DRAFT_1482786 [Hydnum rufescens UP504]
MRWSAPIRTKSTKFPILHAQNTAKNLKHPLLPKFLLSRDTITHTLDLLGSPDIIAHRPDQMFVYMRRLGDLRIAVVIHVYRCPLNPILCSSHIILYRRRWFGNLPYFSPRCEGERQESADQRIVHYCTLAIALIVPGRPIASPSSLLQAFYRFFTCILNVIEFHACDKCGIKIDHVESETRRRRRLFRERFAAWRLADLLMPNSQLTGLYPEVQKGHYGIAEIKPTRRDAGRELWLQFMVDRHHTHYYSVGNHIDQAVRDPRRWRVNQG